ncbi:MAG: hypothetical protein LWY06_05870 [Firmicutes bacterium]|nr:hypothetical protein [Bacillota bacterium]
MKRRISVTTAAVLFFVMLAAVAGFCQERQAITLNGSPGVASASSFCDEYQDMKFTPDQAFNGDAEKPWMAADPFNPKNPEFVKFTFAKPVGLAALRVAPGFGHSQARFYDYPRLKKFTVTLEIQVGKGIRTEKRDYYRKLDGAPQKDMVLFISNQPVVKSFTITITDVYKGKGKNNAVIGSIDPVLIRDGRMYCSSGTLTAVIDFIRSAARSENAFAFLPTKQPIEISKVMHSGNPMDPIKLTKKTAKLTRADIRKNWDMWKEICKWLYADYTFNSWDAVNYYWTDKKTGRMFIDMYGSDTADVMNGFYIEMSKQEVKETIAAQPAEKPEKSKGKNDKKAAKKAPVKEITVVKAVVEKLFMTTDIYTP